MSKQKVIIEVINLTKKYADLVAVNNLSFKVYSGEIFGLLGPNGAGKTTILEIIETLREETDGDVVVGGYSINKEPDKVKAIIGVQLQAAGFYPNLKLTEILELFAALYGVSADPLEMLKKVNLADKAKSSVKELSGGQKQRFSVATTLIHRPAIIFLDEPSTGLDPQARRNLWKLVKEVRNQGTTVVITTHFMDEAEYLCDRVAVIDEGNILAIDKPDNLIDALLQRGFKKDKSVKEANLEDVFLDLTGKELRD
ncbi:MAG TPA: ABC transporter ATP-binding protein [Candidatus Dojkabacteria bacterium]|nr:ABC transporter ATP-binding protein [Candidatus Dojkabacteria bacterium]